MKKVLFVLAMIGFTVSFAKSSMAGCEEISNLLKSDGTLVTLSGNQAGSTHK